MSALLAMPAAPTALIVGNTAQVRCALRALKMSSPNVPDDLSLVVFDDTPGPNWCHRHYQWFVSPSTCSLCTRWTWPSAGSKGRSANPRADPGGRRVRPALEQRTVPVVGVGPLITRETST